MSVVDTLLGRSPPRYDRRNDPRRRKRDPRERKILSVHVDEDEFWRDEHSAGITDLHIEMHGIRQLLLWIIVILIGSKGVDVVGLLGH